MENTETAIDAIKPSPTKEEFKEQNKHLINEIFKMKSKSEEKKYND